MTGDTDGGDDGDAGSGDASGGDASGGDADLVVSTDGPHDGQAVATAGVPLAEADAVVVALHGRGATPASVLDLAREVPDGVAFLAPAAARNTWYPQSFMAPMASNEPWLSSALGVVDSVVSQSVEHVPADRVVVLGFSQGACLGSEYVARNARRYGGLVAFSGGLIGPEGTPREYDGSLDGTPAFLGCSDRDPHIPLERVQESTRVLTDLGGDVDERIYEGMGHTVNRDEVDAMAGIVRDAADR